MDLVAAAHYWATLDATGVSPDDTVLSTCNAAVNSSPEAAVLGAFPKPPKPSHPAGTGHKPAFTGSGIGLGSGLGFENLLPGWVGRSSTSLDRRRSRPLVGQGSESCGSIPELSDAPVIDCHLSSHVNSQVSVQVSDQVSDHVNVQFTECQQDLLIGRPDASPADPAVAADEASRLFMSTPHETPNILLAGRGREICI